MKQKIHTLNQTFCDNVCYIITMRLTTIKCPWLLGEISCSQERGDKDFLFHMYSCLSNAPQCLWYAWRS